MAKSFGICEVCLKAKGQLIDSPSQVVVLEKDIHDVVVRNQKSKYLKCQVCAKPKSAAYQISKQDNSSAQAISTQLLNLSAQGPSERVNAIASWLKRETDHIAQSGRDYWVDEGILFFKEEDKQVLITLNDQAIKPYELYEILG